MKSNTRFFTAATVALVLCFGYLVERRVAASGANFVVTNTSDSGAGSLRQAIINANNNAGADTISFNIPGSDPNCDGTTHVCTITPVTPLDAITDPVTIDGFTQ